MSISMTIFAQIMEFVPRTSFGRIFDRYGGNVGVRRMFCAEQFFVMAFGRLTLRESLRNFEVILGSTANKLYAIELLHSAAYSSSVQALLRLGIGRTRIEERRVRLGRNRDRSVFEPARLGSLSQGQECGQAAHLIGPAEPLSSVYSHR